jgi:hypothetical protein
MIGLNFMVFRFASFLWLVLLINAMLLLGCSKPDPNPELKDPIYKDIEANLKASSKLLVDTEKKLEVLLQESSGYGPRTKEKMVNLRDINKQKKIIENLKQSVAYLQIRLDRRKIQTHIDYSAAYSKKQAWPDPKEFENYKAVKKLKEAPRSWDARVPKLKSEKSE